jgi:hypothetical protein
MFGAFLVVELLGRRLVENTTLTRASDYIDAEMYRIHSRSIWAADYEPQSLQTKSEELQRLRALLLSSDSEGQPVTEHQFLGFADSVRYDNLPPRDDWIAQELPDTSETPSEPPAAESDE